ncbi:MAG: hypothetical protein ACRD3O_07535 [Terriglobia bacterium]
MAYIDPETVVSPRNRVRSVRVIYNGGPGGWSVARVDYDGEECLGFRWNGDEDEPGIGNPQSRGKPTWEILPAELAEVVQERVEKLQDSRYAELRSAYREMAADREREAEAEEWSEALIGDATNQEG